MGSSGDKASCKLALLAWGPFMVATRVNTKGPWLTPVLSCNTNSSRNFNLHGVPALRQVSYVMRLHASKEGQIHLFISSLGSSRYRKALEVFVCH